jgi:transpeptidase family protein/MecA-like transpeptidase family protein/penicillin-binding protein
MIQSSVVTEGGQGTLPQTLTARVTSSGGRRPATRAARQDHLRRRGGPILALCVIAFVAGLVLGARHVPADQRHVERFTDAWERGDYAAMYAQITDADRARISRLRFTRAYQAAMDTATAQRVVAGRPRKSGDRYRVAMRVDTRVFGTVNRRLLVPADAVGVKWSRALLFPGLAAGERLRRVTRLPSRAALLARDTTVLARGDDRVAPSEEARAVAGQVVGSLGPIPADRRAQLARLGVPPSARVGVTGLERIFDARLRGRPGGELLAGRRLLARSVPLSGEAVRTTISLPVEQAAVTALGDRLGGAVALNPRTGAILAFAGIAFSGLQPPGSTFKMITATGALAARITKPSAVYPVQTAATIEGVDLSNAGGESCGGTLLESFAHSCNSVFAPLGARLGAGRLVRAAERYGFNRPPDIPGAAESTIPPADEIGDDLAVGSSAIGQGRVQATTLQMAAVAATIARRGRRPHLTLDLQSARRARRGAGRASSARVARTMERMMLAVVSVGTGVQAAIPGVRVAGKTGTAELRTTPRCQPVPEDPLACPAQQADDPTDTDAWFAAYAPAGSRRHRPRVAVCVMLVGAGAGGDSAAPAARGILEAGLQATA